jgi:hypothetical protein
MIQEMKFTIRTLLAVVTVDMCISIFIFRRHFVLKECSVDPLIVFSHVSERFEASGALVRCLDVLLMTLVMHAVSAGLKLLTKYHKYYSRGRGKHVLSANGTVTFKVSLNALVLAFEAYSHAHVAGWAMEVINPEPLTDAANTAIVAI